MLEIDSLKPYDVYALSVEGVRNADGLSLLHRQASYTLHRMPK